MTQIANQTEPYFHLEAHLLESWNNAASGGVEAERVDVRRYGAVVRGVEMTGKNH